MQRDNFFVPPRNITKRIKALKNKDPRHWEKMGARKLLHLVKFVAEKVPAYKALLARHNIDTNGFQGIESLKKLPVTDKNNYLRKNTYADLFPDRELTKSGTFSATSGSSGKPFYFPREEAQDRQYEYVAEIFLRNQFEIHKKSTLIIIGFGLGIWIGGIFTYKTFNKLSQKGYKLSLIPVGPNKEIYLDAIKNFGHLYDQVVLTGYPPFVKDLIDEAPEYKIDWQQYNIRILTAAEGFSEDFRSYLAKKTGVHCPLNDIINIYGTVEMGTQAHETALANLIRKKATQDENLFKTIFREVNRIPTLAQYHPYIVNFEQSGEEIIASGYGSAIPLVRYRFPDLGEIVSYKEMMSRLEEAGMDIHKEARDAVIYDTMLKLPFVYIYERSDNAISIFGFLIYTEYIKEALLNTPKSHKITGKFTMETKRDKEQNQFLEINIELKKHEKKSTELAKSLQKEIVRCLLKNSSEYRHVYRNDPKYKKRLTPLIKLWSHENPQYFAPGTKQQWARDE